MSADIDIDGEVKTLWCEVANQYGEYLLWERSDAFLSAVLPLAMRQGKNIVCKAPLTEEFLHNLTEILVPQLCKYDSRLFHSRILADGDARELPSGDAVALSLIHI